MTRAVASHQLAQPSLPYALLRIAKLALHALHAELKLSPKPGLVTPHDNGSHCDMNAQTFMRSLASLRHYFRDIVLAGARDTEFSALQRLGCAAEARMLRATGGINTHRGAIFTLGLLGAAAGRLQARGLPLSPQGLCETVRKCWGPAIASSLPVVPSHGAVVRERYGFSGARAEAAYGFPSVLRIGLPALDRALAEGLDTRRSQLQALFTLMSKVPDTNLLYRGGMQGLLFTQAAAAQFLLQGGTQAHGWQESAARIGRDLVARRLSPGGSADLLSATWYLHLLRNSQL
jgi:triphosphoribosyl-dephospho-CoA synthase